LSTGKELYLNSTKFVNKAPRVIFLESQEGIESLFTRGLRTGAIAAGCDVELVFLADATGRPRSEKQVRIDLLVKQPDTVCFLMDAPLDLTYLWDVPSLAAVDKISLWFDDYYRSPKTLAHPEVWTKWQKTHGVRVGIWDGYWRCRAVEARVERPRRVRRHHSLAQVARYFWPGFPRAAAPFSRGSLHRDAQRAVADQALRSRGEMPFLHR